MLGRRPPLRQQLLDIVWSRSTQRPRPAGVIASILLLFFYLFVLRGGGEGGSGGGGSEGGGRGEGEKGAALSLPSFTHGAPNVSLWILTAPRKDTLSVMLDSFLKELKYHYFDPLLINIFSAHPGMDFGSYENKYPSPKFNYIHKPTPRIINEESSTSSLRWAQHRSDIHSLFRAVEEQGCSDRQWFLLLEDDGILCSGAATHLMGVFEEANSRFDDKKVVGIRISYGFNGLMLRCKDVPFLLAIPEAEEPVDQAYDLYWESQGGEMLTYRSHLMEHQDTTSTIQEKAADNARAKELGVLPTCFDVNLSYATPSRERFMIIDCYDHDYSPCPESDGTFTERQRSTPWWKNLLYYRNSKVIKVHSSKVGHANPQTCDHVCKKASMKCWFQPMKLVGCAFMKAAFGCKECKYIGRVPAFVAHYPRNGPMGYFKDDATNVCVTSDYDLDGQPFCSEPIIDRAGFEDYIVPCICKDS